MMSYLYFIKKHTTYTVTLLLFVVYGCSGDNPTIEPFTGEPNTSTTPSNGCDGQVYPELSQSLYVLPYEVGKTYGTGLTNCSSSYHSANQPDQYAFDFNMQLGASFVATRAGTVVTVVESEPSNGGNQSAGNYVVIDHGDYTYGLYYHSPENGIDVEVGQMVEQGQVLGDVGRSGLAGYPHLHFIVVQNPTYPYDGKAISFKNASPADVVLQGNTEYTAEAY